MLIMDMDLQTVFRTKQEADSIAYHNNQFASGDEYRVSAVELGYVVEVWDISGALPEYLGNL